MQLFVSAYEQSVLEMMAAGHTDATIARRHNVGKRTLERQVANLMARVGAPSRVALGAIAARYQWICVDRFLIKGTEPASIPAMPDWRQPVSTS